MKLPLVNNNELILCKRCQSKNIHKVGFRYAVYRGKLQRYKCEECNFVFTLEDRKKFSTELRAFAIKKWMEGISSRKVADLVWLKFNIHICFNQIIRWAEMQGLHKSFNNNKKLLQNCKDLQKLKEEAYNDNRIIEMNGCLYFCISKDKLWRDILRIRQNHLYRIPILRYSVLLKLNRFSYLVDINKLNDLESILSK